MSVRDILRRNLIVVMVATINELVVAAVGAAIVVITLGRRLPLHPDGVRALITDGGRGAVDFALSGPLDRIFGPPLIIIAGFVGLWLFVSRVMEVLVASRFAGREEFTVGQFVRAQAVHVVLVVAFAALGFAAWLGFTGTREIVANWYDRRAADLVIVASTLPALVVFVLLQILDDLAVLRIGAGQDLLTSFTEAVSRIRANPVRLVGVRVAVYLASLAILLTGAAFSWRADRTMGLAVIACIVMQQLCAASRILLRLGWLAHLASFWRAR